MSANKRTFGDCASLHRGYDLPSSVRAVGQIPVFGSTGVVGWHVEAKVAGPGVVTGRSGSIGEVAFVEGDYWPLNTTLYVDDFKGNDPRYVAYLLEAMDLRQYSNGSAVPTLNRNLLTSVLVYCPDLPTQCRIVDLLSSADASVESLGVGLAAARNVRRQLLIDAVRGHAASPASNLVKLGDVVESQLGKMLNTSRQTGEGARPYLRAGNITGWGKLRLEDLKSMDFGESELDKFSVKTGDLLVTEGGDAGRCVVYAGEEALCFQNAIHRVRADKSKTSNEYLALVLESLSVTRQLDRYCSTTTIKHLSSGSLKSIELCLPTLAVQQSAVANIKAATTLAEAVSSRLQQAKHLRDQLLHDLLSGSHTIPESYDRFLAEAPL